MDDSEFAFDEGKDGDDEFNGIAECGVEETAEGLAYAQGELFGCEA